MSFDFMSFANQEANLGNAYQGLLQDTRAKKDHAANAYTQAVKLTQLNFDEAANSAKTMIEGGMESIGGIEGAHQLWRGAKKIYNKLKSKADEFNQNELDKLDKEMADKTEDSFKVKVTDEEAGDGLENQNDAKFVDEDGVEYEPIDDVGETLGDQASDLTGNLADNLGSFGENLGSGVEDLASNIGEMGTEFFSNAINSLKSGAKNGIDAMTDFFNGLGPDKGVSSVDIEMTDLGGDTTRMPVTSDYQQPFERSQGNFGEKVNPVQDDDGVELTDFQKNSSKISDQENALEQSETGAQKDVAKDQQAENDLEDGDVEGAEDIDPEVEEAIGDVGEELGGELAEEAVATAFDWSPIGWILSIGGGIAAATTSAVGIANEIKAGHREEDALSQANQKYNLAKAQVANFNPSGQYAIPSMNSLANIGQ